MRPLRDIYAGICAAFWRWPTLKLVLALVVVAGLTGAYH